MWFTYIIYSKSLDKYYVGHSKDVKLRLERHNTGWSRFTSKATDWELKYTEIYNTKPESAKRETYIKKMKSRKYIETLITTGGRPD